MMQLEQLPAGAVIVMATLGVLQKSPAPWFDPLKALRNTFDWVILDEAGQVVDVEGSITESMLRVNGRIILFGDRKQLSCYSQLGLTRRSAMDAAMQWQCSIPLCECFRLKGTLGEFFCQTVYAEEKMRLHNRAALKSLVFVEVNEPHGSGLGDACPRSSERSAAIEAAIIKLLLHRKRAQSPNKIREEEIHYISFYKAQKSLFKDTFHNWNELNGIHSVDGAQGLDVAGWIVLSFGRRRGVGFLSDVRRLIVSLTRAQEGTIMVIHSAVANTQRPVGVFFRALREIARDTNAYVVANADGSHADVAANVCELLETPLSGPPAEAIAATLAKSVQGFPRGKSIKDAVDEYCKWSLATLDEEILDDVSEMELPEEPCEDCNSDEDPSPAHGDDKQMQVKNLGSRLGCDEWMIVIVKNVNVLVAKYSWEQTPWTGIDALAAMFVAALKEVFDWPQEHATFLGANVNVLWTLSFGGWTKKESHITIQDIVTRKTKLVGCLPASLWKTSEIVDGKLCKAVFTKLEAHEKTYSTKVPADYTYDKKCLIVDVEARGEMGEMLLKIEENKWLKDLASGTTDSQRSLAACSFAHMADPLQQNVFAFQ